jgi:serine/threonine-protein kinase
MALEPGSRLGDYEIVSSLGAGGMGEVYRARDTTLGREVAIKLLLEEVSADAERLARFEREAQVLASLNHPNVATLYGFSRHGETSFLVMELVEGETLADRLTRGALTVGEAIPLFLQIAEGLEAAHAKGVIHRDLKPANVKITPKGVVKILDFGLAKATEDDPTTSDPSMTASPTLTLAATQRGEILGTAAYMSPEQAQGLPADKRADAWAFGVCLWEAVVGRRAFEADNASLTLARVLDREPEWERLPDDLPWRVREVLRRCLKKNPDERLHDVADARLELREALSDPAAAGPGSPRQPVEAASGARSGGALPWVVGAVVGAALAGAAAWMLRPAPAALDPVRSFLSSTTQPVSVSSALNDVAISPDGRSVVFRTTRGLHLQRLDEVEGRNLLPDAGFRGGPFFSPDGQWVGFYEGAGGELRRVSIQGGAALTITSTSSLTPGATWGEDGTVFFAMARDISLYRVPASGGQPEPVALELPDGFRAVRWPELLPGERALLVTLLPTLTAENAQIGLVDLETGEGRSLLPAGSHAVYVPTGHLVYGLLGSLMAVRFDLESLEVLGDPVPVVENVVTKTNSGAGGFSVSREGSLVYLSGDVTASGLGRRPVWVDRSGVESAIDLEAATWTAPRVSPRGGRILFYRFEGDQDIWAFDDERGIRTRLTFEPELDHLPAWSADGREVFFGSMRDGPSAIYRRRADGSGAPELVYAAGEDSVAPQAATADGRRLIYRTIEVIAGGRSNLGVLDLETGEARLLFDTAFGETRVRVSPDDRWIAYDSDESGVREVYVRPFPDVDAGRWQVSNGGGMSPLWSPTGDALIYRGYAPDPSVMEVPVSVGDENELTFGAARVLFADIYSRISTPSSYWDIDATGERFVMLTPRTPEGEASTTPEVVLVQNWFTELERLVPTD